MSTTWLRSTLGLALLLAPAPSFAQATQAKGYPTLGTIERIDPRFDRIVPRDAKVERLADGFDWSEGPVWVREGRYLLFSDVPRNAVFQWKEAGGVVSTILYNPNGLYAIANPQGGLDVFLRPSGYTGQQERGGEPGSNGLTLDPKGRLVLCQHGDRRVARRESDGKLTAIADRYEGKRFNSPNDAVYKSNGDLYFTDPPYGLLKLNDDPAKELDFNGVYRVKPDGSVTLLTKEMTFPNGLAFAPDEKTLYVANSDPNKAIWMAFPVESDGNLGKGRVFFDATKWAKAGKKGLPDGLKVDEAGNLFATGPGGVHVFAPDGTHLGTFNTGEATANCAWGGDGSTLYITADMYLARVRLNTKGKIPGP